MGGLGVHGVVPAGQLTAVGEEELRRDGQARIRVVDGGGPCAVPAHAHEAAVDHGDEALVDVQVEDTWRRGHRGRRRPGRADRRRAGDDNGAARGGPDHGSSGGGGGHDGTSWDAWDPSVATDRSSVEVGRDAPRLGELDGEVGCVLGRQEAHPGRPGAVGRQTLRRPFGVVGRHARAATAYPQSKLTRREQQRPVQTVVDLDPDHHGLRPDAVLPADELRLLRAVVLTVAMTRGVAGVAVPAPAEHGNAAEGRPPASAARGGAALPRPVHEPRPGRDRGSHGAADPEHCIASGQVHCVHLLCGREDPDSHCVPDHLANCRGLDQVRFPREQSRVGCGKMEDVTGRKGWVAWTDGRSGR